MKKSRLSSAERDSWSLDHAFGKWVVPRLIHIRDFPGYPAQLTARSWKSILNAMIRGFSFVASEKYWAVPRTDKQQAIIDRALHLFTEHFASLWT